jgi:hypothetical protein
MNPFLAIAAGAAMLLAAGAIRGALSGASKSVSGGGGGSSGGSGSSGNFNSQTITVQVEGKISGKDIVIASRRYNADN